MIVALLLDWPFLLLVFVPFLAWVIGPDSLHPVVALVTVAAVVLLAAPMWARARRRYAALRAASPPEDGWRWPERMPAPAFQARCSGFLRLHGWRLEVTHVGENGIVEIQALKDRARIVLHCLPPGTAPEEAMLAALATARSRAGATRAALVCGAKPPTAMLTAAGRRGLLLFRNNELEAREPLLSEP